MIDSRLNKLNVVNIQNVAAALEMPADIFFKPDNVLVAEPDTAYFDRDEQQLFKLFRTIREPAARTLLIEVARLA